MKRRFEKIRVIEGPVKYGPKLRDKTGIFVVSLDPDALMENLERAATNKSRVSFRGPLKVEYQPMTPKQLDVMRPLLTEASGLTPDLTDKSQATETNGVA